jgi:phosphohistidine phosphatase
MYLYLIRHGIAEDPDPLAPDPFASDELRSLTKVGRKKIAQVADRLLELELHFDLIMASPLVRARQTADLLLEKQLSTTLEVSEDLKPMGSLESWLAAWNASTPNPRSTIALIGHEPNLSEWAELLIFGEVFHKLILKKGGIIGLKFPDDRVVIGTAELTCLISPKYLI